MHALDVSINYAVDRSNWYASLCISKICSHLYLSHDWDFMFYSLKM